MVSSAYWLILHSVPSILIPLVLVSFRIALANISVHKMKVYGESGHHCLAPHSKLKNSVAQQLALNSFINYFDPRN